MNTRISLLIFVLVVGLASYAQGLTPITNDKDVRIGHLSNGLTYYIRHNEEPKNQADFYIAQKVGSVQEDDNQRGLAHFLEHIAFNGSAHFPGNSLISYCERIGVKFGQNLNAYTSTDETVYNIDNVPVSEQTNIDTCLLILSDWSGRLTLAPEEIDKERGVIHEEWRLRSSANQRIINRQLPNLYPGSKYGERMPIGLMSIIDNFSPEFLRAYYEKWYHPSLQGIVAVGDIDVDYVEGKIKEYFSDLTNPADEAQYEYYPVPDNEEPIYIIDKDKEMQYPYVTAMFKRNFFPFQYRNTVEYLANSMISSIATSCLNERLQELAQKPDCPFLNAGVSDDAYLVSKTCEALSLTVIPKDGMDSEALQAAMSEIARARQHGFADTEVKRCTDEMLSSMEKIYNNRTKQRNSLFTSQYVRHFLENEPIPSIEDEYELSKQIYGIITAQQVSEYFKMISTGTDKNFVLLAMYPEKEGTNIPTAEAFRNAVNSGFNASVDGYIDEVNDEPFIATLPAPVKIKKEQPSDFGYTKWTLSNGANVYYLQTDFNDSQVIMSARSKGGSNTLADDQRVNIALFNSAISVSGIGQFKSTELNKKLAGKQVGCGVSLGDNSESLSGSSTPKDLRTLFELIYLRFQDAPCDVDSYNNLLQSVRLQLANIDKDPSNAFSDSVKVTLYGRVPRLATIKAEDLDQADYEQIRQIYRQRFQSAGDFDFYFTGAFNTDSLRAFVEQYIAPLPGLKKREGYHDLNIRPLTGQRTNNFIREMETPKANIVEVWTGDTPYSLKQGMVASALGSALDSRYLKSIREEGSMAYSVSASASCSYGLHETYTLQVACPVKPDSMDVALQAIDQALLDIARDGITAEELTKFREYQLKSYAESQRLNSYWHGLITSKVTWGRDNRQDYEATLQSITSDDVKNFVNQIVLRDNNRAIITMLPANRTEEEK